MEFGTVVFRTLFAYFFLLVILRLMGKREIGQLSVLDFVVSIMIAELAVMSIEDVNVPIRDGVTPIIVLSSVQILMAYLSLKSPRIRRLADGRPSFLIRNGEINEKEMKRQRYNFDDLLMQVRQKDIKNISDVEFAILEANGQLSVFAKEDEENKEGDDDKEDKKQEVSSYPLTLIVDGEIQEGALNEAQKDELWLRRELRKASIESIKTVSYCVLRTDGTMYIDLKND
ncbi:DUF421 domain-containing protein [Alteribacillus sp. HJP-4]|uniref:DUF421 domain-containing protein n=1 Tax=Alteribacillus sp. HJP-4 TaxID=2775394 RepID=UPI0035CD2F32